jgi:hypothetical protein
VSGARGRLFAVALAAVPLLGGCVVFKAPPKLKQTDERTVRVSFTICASYDDDDSTCQDEGNSQSSAQNGDTSVVLMGFRVPEGTRMPREISPTVTEVRGTLRRNRQYGRVLNDEAPTPAGFRWIGYRSGPETTNREDIGRFKIDIRLPRDFSERRFRVRPVVGFYAPDPPEHPADAAVVCGPALFDRVDDDDGDRACIDSPSPDEVARHLSVRVD